MWLFCRWRVLRRLLLLAQTIFHFFLIECFPTKLYEAEEIRLCNRSLTQLLENKETCTNMANEQ